MSRETCREKLGARGEGGLADAREETLEEESLAEAARRLKAIIVGSLGNLVEWYDFYVYVTAF